MQCTGCAAKVSAAPLSTALHSLVPTSHSAPAQAPLAAPEPGSAQAQVTAAGRCAEVDVVGLRDDVTLLPRAPDGILQLQTVDFLSACTSDLFLFGRIAAVHAMSDCFASGAKAISALAIAQVCHPACTAYRQF